MRRVHAGLAAGMLLIAACDDEVLVPPTQPPVGSVVVDSARVVFDALGQQATVTAELLDVDGEPIDDEEGIVWTSLDEVIATVSESGTIEAQANGITRVVATYDGVADSVLVYVAQQVASLVVGADSLELVMGDTASFPVSALDANGHAVPFVRFEWGKVDESSLVVGVVSSSLQRGVRGGVIATAPGETEIEVVAPATGVSERVHVRVTGNAVDFASVTAGGFHSCGLDQAGVAYCWGALYIGQYPVIGGFGTASFRAPVQVETELRFDTLASGHSHACGLVDGQAYCWGQGGVGELGNGSFGSSKTPVAVTGGHTFESLAVGQFHTCGLLASGQALCWGSNIHGTIGDSTLVDRNVPTPVEGGLEFASISAGPYHTCGLTSDGVAYCWGLNDTKQLGTTAGDTVCESIISVNTCALAPVAVETGDLVIESIHAGGYHTCALDPDGAAWCWGRNDLGELGTGTASQGGIIEPQPVTGGHTFASLSTTMAYTCGREADGEVRCWGSNDYGQIGSTAAITCFTSWLTAEPCMPTPTGVSGGIAFDVIDTGTFFACGYATTGIPYCWGSNDSGQLGAGGDAPFASAEPLAVLDAT